MRIARPNAEMVNARSACTDEQIALALGRHALGVPAEEICRDMSISESTFRSWQKRFAALGPDNLRRLRLLEAENRRLRASVELCTRLIAELALDKALLKNALSKRH